MAFYYAIALLGMLAVFSSWGNALDDNMLKTTVYIQQLPYQNQRGVAEGTAVISWYIKDGPGASANTIGHAEGLVILTDIARSSCLITTDLVFDGGSLAGSSLQVMGQHESSGQWSIMGGTGQFTMARGFR
uniref:Dirigent protein n=1 Tax=Zea mays TaxID=4577 RepID=A0A804PH76_MAIZE